MDWDDLRFVLAVERAGSILGASRALDVDKATVSRRIAGLEAALGVLLFERRPSGLQVTGHGVRVVDAAQKIGALVTELAEDARAAQGEAKGRVLVTAPQWFCSEFLLPM